LAAKDDNSQRRILVFQVAYEIVGIDTRQRIIQDQDVWGIALQTPVEFNNRRIRAD